MACSQARDTMRSRDRRDTPCSYFGFLGDPLGAGFQKVHDQGRLNPMKVLGVIRFSGIYDRNFDEPQPRELETKQLVLIRKPLVL